jgi:exopolysaccharide biosynthesis polyprenyl glycosylphosphotransferase
MRPELDNPARPDEPVKSPGTDSEVTQRHERAQLEAVRRTRMALFDEGFWSKIQRRKSNFFRFIKRFFDILVSLTAIILLSPILITVAIAIKLESRGPLVFKQLRAGKFNIPFTMLKFRSMRVDAEYLKESLMSVNEMDGPVFKIKEDPRITRVGKFIRRWSIDELPQLFNVLRGDMSVVGPRPLPVVEVAEMTESQMRRHSVKPGLTCIWQISGRNEISFDEWIQLDLIYVDNQSAVLDLEIFLRTFAAVLKRKGSS